MEGDRAMGDRDVTHKIMIIINHTKLEAIEAKKLNAPVKTKMTAAKASRTVHDAVMRIKIILIPLSVDGWRSRRHHLHASNTAGITPIAPSPPPLAFILMEEVAEEAYIGGGNKAQESEYEGVNRDHFFYLSFFLVGCGLMARS